MMRYSLKELLPFCVTLNMHRYSRYLTHSNFIVLYCRYYRLIFFWMKETLGLDKVKKYPFICGWHLRHKGKTLTDCHRRVLFFKLSVNMSLDKLNTVTVFKFKLNKTKHQNCSWYFWIIVIIQKYHKQFWCFVCLFSF